MNKDIWKIYFIKNTINDKIYVGQTKQAIKRRFKSHLMDKDGGCCKLFNAFNCYGRDNFYIEEIISCSNQSDANYLEEYFISLLKTQNDKFGYNIRGGGSRGLLSDESKAKMSKARMGRFTGEENPFFGHHHTAENKNILSELTKARVQGEDNPFFGKTHSEETKNKISEINKLNNQGENNPMFGKTHSIETIEKISKSRIGKTAGKNNPMYGKRHSPELLKQIAESNKGKLAWNKGLPNSEATKEKMKFAWIKRRADKELAKQMQQFYQSTIYYNLEV